MLVVLIAAKGCYEPFWRILSVFMCTISLTWLDFFFIYKMLLKRIRTTTITTATPNYWRAECQVLGWATSMGGLDDPTEAPLSATFQKDREMTQLVQCHFSNSEIARAKLKSCSLQPLWHLGSWGGAPDTAGQHFGGITRLGARHRSVSFEPGAWLWWLPDENTKMISFHTFCLLLSNDLPKS